MASGSAYWDLNGNTRQSLPSGQSQTSGSSSGSTRGTDVTSSTQTSSVAQRNTPQFALDALQGLISQLSDRPAISDAELDKIAPLPNLQDYVLYQTNATLGSSFGGYDYAKFNRDMQLAQAKRQEAIQQAGVIPGGTVEMKAQAAERKKEIDANRTQRSAYSKEAAIADTNALTGRYTRQLMEQLLPQITRAAEASGTSGGAVQGLLAQDLAARVAEAQAAVGIDASVKYGAIANQASAILEELTKQNNPVMTALLQALGIAKGTVNEGTTTTSTTSVSDKNVNESKDTEQETIQQGLTQALMNIANGIKLSNVSASGIPNAAMYTLNDSEAIYDESTRSGVSQRIQGVSF